MKDEDWQPERQVHLVGEGDCAQLNESAQAERSVTLLEDFGNRLGMQVRVNADGWLVLADTDYPGWGVLVDGSPADIHTGKSDVPGCVYPGGNNYRRVHLSTYVAFARYSDEHCRTGGDVGVVSAWRS